MFSPQDVPTIRNRERSGRSIAIKTSRWGRRIPVRNTGAVSTTAQTGEDRIEEVELEDEEAPVARPALQESHELVT